MSDKAEDSGVPCGKIAHAVWCCVEHCEADNRMREQLVSWLQKIATADRRDIPFDTLVQWADTALAVAGAECGAELRERVHRERLRANLDEQIAILQAQRAEL